MGNVITLPGKERSDRERLVEVRKMKEKIVMGKVTDLSTYKKLGNVEGLLKQKIKIAEGPSGRALPKDPA